jgi:inner membrane protein involved in colicin E2 resistance
MEDHLPLKRAMDMVNLIVMVVLVVGVVHLVPVRMDQALVLGVGVLVLVLVWALAVPEWVGFKMVMVLCLSRVRINNLRLLNLQCRPKDQIFSRAWTLSPKRGKSWMIFF